MLTVTTGWSPNCWDTYAKPCMESFEKFWSPEVRLMAYVEESANFPRAEQFKLSNIRECHEFLDRHEDNPTARGEKNNGRWKQKEIDKGYSFRFDAYKFCRQAFIMHDAAVRIGSGLMVWLDADVLTHAPVRASIAEDALKGADISYLGRGPKHPEIGFLAFRLPQALPVLEAFSGYYKTDDVFNLPEWHSAFVFKKSLDQSRVRSRDMTPNGKGHVWLQSELASFSEHLKGSRKERVYKK